MALRRNLRTAGPDGEPHGSPIGFLFSCPDPLRKGRFKIRLFLIQQSSHAGQLFALHKFQRRAATGGDMGHLIRIA